MELRFIGFKLRLKVIWGFKQRWDFRTNIRGFQLWLEDSNWDKRFWTKIRGFQLLLEGSNWDKRFRTKIRGFELRL